MKTIFKQTRIQGTSVGLAVMVSVLIVVISPTPLNAAGACYPVPDGIVSWWPGNGNGNDVIGPNNGNLKNNVTFSAGMVGAGFDFDGASSVEAPTTGLPIGSSSRTLEMWVNEEKPLGDITVFGGYGVFGNYNQTFHLGSLVADSTSTNFYFSQWGASISSPIQQNSTWHHVAASNDNGYVMLYVDGVSVSSGVFDIATPPNTTFYIGGVPGYLFKGIVDEVSVYNRALSQEEILGIFDAGNSGKCMPVPFNKFSADVTLNSEKGKPTTLTFKSDGNLLGATSDGVKPRDEPFQLKIGNISVNLPANTLTQKGVLYTYEGSIANDRQLEVTVKANFNSPEVSVKAIITGNNLNGEWGAPVKLTIGNDRATGMPNELKETYKQQ